MLKLQLIKPNHPFRKEDIKHIFLDDVQICQYISQGVCNDFKSVEKSHHLVPSVVTETGVVCTVKSSRKCSSGEKRTHADLQRPPKQERQHVGADEEECASVAEDRAAITAKHKPHNTALPQTFMQNCCSHFCEAETCKQRKDTVYPKNLLIRTNVIQRVQCSSALMNAIKTSTVHTLLSLQNTECIVCKWSCCTCQNMQHSASHNAMCLT